MPGRTNFCAGNPANAASVAARMSLRTLVSKICLRRKNCGKAEFIEAETYPLAKSAATLAHVAGGAFFGVRRQAKRDAAFALRAIGIVAFEKTFVLCH